MDMAMATPTKRTRADFYPSPELRKALDRWRLDLPGEPSRAEVVRQIVEEALIQKGVYKPAAAKRKAKP